MKPAVRKTKSCGARLRRNLVLIACLKRDWTLRSLSERIGLKPRTFYPALSEGRLGAASRAEIERAFDFTEPIWSSPRELLLRKLAFKKAGVDPATLNKDVLEKFARKLGVRYRNDATRAEVLDAVIDFFAANPNPSRST